MVSLHLVVDALLILSRWIDTNNAELEETEDDSYTFDVVLKKAVFTIALKARLVFTYAAK